VDMPPCSRTAWTTLRVAHMPTDRRRARFARCLSFKPNIIPGSPTLASLYQFAVKAAPESGCWGSRDGVSAFLQSANESPLGAFSIMLVEVLRAEVFKVTITGDQVIDDRQQRMR